MKTTIEKYLSTLEATKNVPTGKSKVGKLFL